VPQRCRAAAKRVLWLHEEVERTPAEDLEALDDAMRVLDAAYVGLEHAALRLRRGHPLRDIALRLLGARRTWLAVVGDLSEDADQREDEAAHEVDRALDQLRALVDRLDDGGKLQSNVVALPRRKSSSSPGDGT
jgi:hypothetical protein